MIGSSHFCSFKHSLKIRLKSSFELLFHFLLVSILSVFIETADHIEPADEISPCLLYGFGL